MKKTLVFFSVVLLLLTLVLMSSCQGKNVVSEQKGNDQVGQTELGEDTVEKIDKVDDLNGSGVEYTITFVVSGNSVQVKVPSGTIPTYPGVIPSWEDGSHFYKFVGWDKDVVAATANTTYTAVIGEYGLETYTVLWRTLNGLITTTVHKGETPTPPSISTVRLGTETVNTFTGNWSPALSPATSDRKVYTAQYEVSTRYYTVNFMLNGNIVGTASCLYQETPTVPSGMVVPSGYNYLYWTGFGPVTQDNITYTGIATSYNPDTIQSAIQQATGASANARAYAAQYLALVEMENPGIVTDALLTYLRYAIGPGHDPTLDFIPNFYQPQEAGAIACCKEIPGVWNQLTTNEIEKLDYLMKGMACTAAIASDDSNSYTTGPGFTGNYGKSWNPNYPISNITMILFAVSYFDGAANVNQILKDFDYDTYVAKFTEWGWTNTLSRWTRETTSTTVAYQTAGEGTLKEKWYGTIKSDDGNGHLTLEITTSSEDVAAQNYANASWGLVAGTKRTINYTTPKAMLMEGGEVYCMTALYRVSQYVGKSGGTGLGIPAIGQKGYQYQGYSLDQVDMIWAYLQNYNYSGGVVASKEVLVDDTYLCYIADGTRSPVEGLTGMMKEFRSGQRSSVGYCSHDYIMGVAATAGLEALGLYSSHGTPEREQLTRNVWVGNTDFLYKAEHGYVSYTGTAVRGDPVITYAKGAGDLIWRSYWLDTGAKEYSLDDFEFPDPEKNVPLTVVDNYASASGSNDMTVTWGTSKKTTGSEWWKGNSFIQEVSVLTETEKGLSSIDIRLRKGSNRSGVMKLASGCSSLQIYETVWSAVDSSPLTISLGENGWHRLAFGLFEETSANEGTQSVDYSFTLTIWVDGEWKGSYTAISPSTFVTNGWNLYTAAYDASAEGHLTYTDNSGVYWQGYTGKVFNDTSKSWIFRYGDSISYADTGLRGTSVPVTYSLNGGSFEKTDVFATKAEGYTSSYTVSRVAWFAYSKTEVLLETPVRAGYTFGGWYTNEDFEGDPISFITTNIGGSAVDLFAKWIAE